MTAATLPDVSCSSNGRFTLLLGDARDVLAATMSDESVNCVVTSPPYYGLGRHGIAAQGHREATPHVYVDDLRAVFAEVRRVLAADGTLWLNLGDSYVCGPAGPNRSSGLLGRPNAVTTPEGYGGRDGGGPPAKWLLGMPWRAVFALQADGWILRNAIIWYKPDAVPGSARDCAPSRHEYVFLLVKQARYWFDLDAIREPLSRPEAAAHPPPVGGRQDAAGCVGGSARRRSGRSCRSQKYETQAAAFRGRSHGTHILPTGKRHTAAHPRGRNPGDVWTAATSPYPSAHFATHPVGIPMRCIAAGCRPGGTVLDPFSGAATTGLAALQLGHRYVGIDIDPAYHELAIQRLLACVGQAGHPPCEPA